MYIFNLSDDHMGIFLQFSLTIFSCFSFLLSFIFFYSHACIYPHAFTHRYTYIHEHSLSFSFPFFTHFHNFLFTPSKFPKSPHLLLPNHQLFLILSFWFILYLLFPSFVRFVIHYIRVNEGEVDEGRGGGNEEGEE